MCVHRKWNFIFYFIFLDISFGLLYIKVTWYSKSFRRCRCPCYVHIWVFRFCRALCSTKLSRDALPVRSLSMVSKFVGAKCVMIFLRNAMGWERRLGDCLTLHSCRLLMLIFLYSQIADAQNTRAHIHTICHLILVRARAHPPVRVYFHLSFSSAFHFLVFRALASCSQFSIIIWIFVLCWRSEIEDILREQ